MSGEGGTHVAGTGRYLPERVLANAEVAAAAGVTEPWTVRRTGIRERRVAAEGESAAAMAERAARPVMEAAGITPEEVGVVVVATSTPDHLTPPTACELQAGLGRTGRRASTWRRGSRGGSTRW